MPKAARIRDPIGHSPTMNWLLKGLLIGAAVAAAGVLIVGTGGLAAAAIIGGVAAAGAGIGEVLSTMSWAPKEVVGAILGACSANVHTNSRRAARAHADVTQCSKHPSPPPPIAEGSGTVSINSLPAARVDDRTVCSAVITDGSPNVNIGGPKAQTDTINPENLVPGWVHAALLVVGLASACILAGPVVAVAGLAGSMIGGAAFSWVGGKIWGEGSDGQKWAMLGGSILGGVAGAKGGAWFDRNYVVTSEGMGSNLGNLRIRPRAELGPKPAIGEPGAAEWRYQRYVADKAAAGEEPIPFDEYQSRYYDPAAAGGRPGRPGGPAHSADVDQILSDNPGANGNLAVGDRVPDAVGQPGESMVIRGNTIEPQGNGRVIVESDHTVYDGTLPDSAARAQLRDMRVAAPDDTLVLTDCDNPANSPLVYPPGTQPPPPGPLGVDPPTQVPYP